MPATVTSTNEPPDYSKMLEMNEALVLGSVRQHEMTEAAEDLNAQLLVEMGERRLAQEALRASEEFNRSIVESSRDCLKVLDLAGNLILMSRGGQELLCLDDIGLYLGKSWIDFWKGDDREAARAAVETAAAGGTGQFVGYFHTLRGNRKWWDVMISPIRDASGQPERLLAVSRDATERRALEDALAAKAAELARVDRSKDEFLAMLAHELRNPLAPLPMVVTMLREATDPAEIAEGCDVIQRQVTQLVHLVDDLLDVARINEGKIDLRLADLDLAEPLRMAFDSSRPAILAAGHRMTWTWPPTPLHVQADLVRLTQIFVNLLNNAAKYSHPGGSISVIVQHEGGEALVRVKDTGFGIAPEVLPQVFDLFTQSHQGGRARGGLGIGLNVVKRMVEMHGGTVRVESELGVGSEFTVRLPLTTVPAAPAPAAAAPVQKAAALRRILVVDDNVDAARILGAMLQGQGHEVRVVHEGWAAIAAAPEFAPDTVLLDLGLPDIGGLEVARALHKTHPRALLIAVTSWGQEKDRRRSREAGCAHHFVKPVDPATLREVLAAK